MNGVLACMGIVLVVGSALAAAIFAVVFSVTGRRLRKRLYREYGGKNG